MSAKNCTLLINSRQHRDVLLKKMSQDRSNCTITSAGHSGVPFGAEAPLSHWDELWSRRCTHPLGNYYVRPAHATDHNPMRVLSGPCADTFLWSHSRPRENTDAFTTWPHPTAIRQQRDAALIWLGGGHGLQGPVGARCSLVKWMPGSGSEPLLSLSSTP